LARFPFDVADVQNGKKQNAQSFSDEVNFF